MNSGSRPLVLLHGFTGCSEVWNDVMTALGDEYRCIAPDLPGHGAQAHDLPADAYSFTGVCAMLIEKLDQAEFAEINLWGYSMGGRIALHFALAYPGRVHSLILESTSPGIADEDVRTQRLQVDSALADRLVTDGLERFVDQWMDQPLFATQKLLSPMRQELGRRLRMQNDAESLAAALRGFSVGNQGPLHDCLRDLPMPVLVMVGELDAKYRGTGEGMTRSIPNVQLRIIPQAGHAPHWEQPAETAAAVAEFLDGVEHGFPRSRE